MKRLKLIVNKFIKPKGWPLIIFHLFFLFCIGCSLTLFFTKPDSIYTYVFYALSVISFIYLVYTIIYYSPKIRGKTLEYAKRYSFTNNLVYNFSFRTGVFASFSFVINIGYAIFEGTMGIIASSIWFGALATYYIVLSLVRGLILSKARKYHKQNLDENDLKIRNTKLYRICGIFLIILTIALSVAIAEMVYSNKGFQYGDLMIYIFATYAFYKITLSIINIIKAKKHDNYVTQAFKNINLADSFVSILALQTAMFAAFAPDENYSVVNAITGGVVLILITALGLNMIIKANKKLKNKEVNIYE